MRQRKRQNSYDRAFGIKILWHHKIDSLKAVTTDLSADEMSCMTKYTDD